jgi:hypothetical protein
MAKEKKSFIAYSDWKGTFDALPNDKAGELIKHIFAYVNDENPKTDDILINAVFSNIKNSLKRDLEKWEKQHNQRKLAGKKSAEVRKRNATAVNGRSISSTVSVSDNVTVNDNVIKKTILDREADFKKSLQPFLDKYGKDLLNDFFLYWTEKNPNGKKMKFEMQKTFSVQSRLIRWNKNNFNNKTNGKSNKSKPTMQELYDQHMSNFADSNAEQ